MTDYVLKHWRGQFPLAQSCWTNGALVMLAFAVWFEIAGGYLAAHPPLRLGIFILIMLMPFAVFVPVAAWSGIGIWRSAGRRIDFARPVWGWIARAVVLVAAAAMFIAAIMLAGAGRAILLAPANPSIARYEVTLRGNTAVFHGEITAEAADELELLLKDRSVKRLAIAGSNGGDTTQALRLAGVIHDRKLFVVGLAQCDAACTLLLAAGRVRAIVPDTIVGFGAPSDAAGRLYRQAGLSAKFLDGLRQLRTGALFEPPLYTLIASGFLTDIFVNASHRYVPAPKWCANNLAACGRTGRGNVDSDGHPGGERDGK